MYCDRELKYNFWHFPQLNPIIIYLYTLKTNYNTKNGIKNETITFLIKMGSYSRLQFNNNIINQCFSEIFFKQIVKLVRDNTNKSDKFYFVMSNVYYDDNRY